MLGRLAQFEAMHRLGSWGRGGTWLVCTCLSLAGLWGQYLTHKASSALVAADEIQKQVSLGAHGSFSVMLDVEICSSLPFRLMLLSLPLPLFPRHYQRELQTKLFSILASLYVSDEIRFKPGSILYSADSNQTETSVTQDMIASIFTLFRPLIVLSCSSRSRREQRSLNCSPSGWNQLP